MRRLGVFSSIGRRALALGTVLLGLSLFTVGCGDPGCDGNEVELVDDSPRVIRMDMLQDPVSGDPWELVFVVDFTDSNGDLGNGAAEFFVGTSHDATPLDLFDLFRQSGLPTNATDGRLGIALRFGEEVPDGQTVRLSMQLVDAAGHRSNCYSLDLKFKVRQLTSRWRPCGSAPG